MFYINYPALRAPICLPQFTRFLTAFGMTKGIWDTPHYFVVGQKFWICCFRGRIDQVRKKKVFRMKSNDFLGNTV